MMPPNPAAGQTRVPLTADPRALLRTLPQSPGVYRMLETDGTLLYVGKAKNLKKRVSSYFGRAQNARIQAMVARIAAIEITVTRTESEALLLESNLIKSLQPRYNVLLRDDKSYPFIALTADGPFPRFVFHRGPRREPGRLFGPYPSAAAVRETLHLLPKLFPVRQCEDSVFQNRSRPCLQYQIKRCSGPCVGLVDAETHARDVAHTVDFLEGRTEAVIDELAAAMDQAAAALNFERAAVLRDRIGALRQIQQFQYLHGERGDLDLVAGVQAGGLHCVQVFFVRGGRNLGNKGLFPEAPEDIEPPALMAAFLAQFYADKEIPPEVVVNVAPEDRALLEAALSERAGHQVRIRDRVRAERARGLELAVENARVALKSRLDSQADQGRRLEALRAALGLERTPARIECFDISHTGGERAVAACVVFADGGPSAPEYRRFNIADIVPGDDYAALHQALSRRYRRIQAGECPRPDLLLIDGGRGQLNAVARALRELGVGELALVGVAKGPERRVGTEQLWLLGRDAPIILAPDSPAMHLIARIRDEAHRFAITGHRRRRAQARTRSGLEDLPGIGPRRRQRLLTHFGGLRGLAGAAAEDIARVAGIGRRLAQQIHDSLHQETAAD